MGKRKNIDLDWELVNQDELKLIDKMIYTIFSGGAEVVGALRTTLLLGPPW